MVFTKHSAKSHTVINLFQEKVEVELAYMKCRVCPSDESAEDEKELPF